MNKKYESPKVQIISIEPDESIMEENGTTPGQEWSLVPMDLDNSVNGQNNIPGY